MRIFEISSNYKSRSIVAENYQEYIDKFGFDVTYPGKSLKDKWDFLEFYLDDLKRKESNFYSWDINGLSFNENTLAIFQSHFQNMGEILDFNIEGEKQKYFYLNILNTENTTLVEEVRKKAFRKNGTIVHKHAWVFDPNKVKSSLFLALQKAKNKDYIDVLRGPFCTSGLLPEDQEFYHIYHKHNMTGLEFEEMFLVDESYPDLLRE